MSSRELSVVLAKRPHTKEAVSSPNGEVAASVASFRRDGGRRVPKPGRLPFSLRKALVDSVKGGSLAIQSLLPPVAKVDPALGEQPGGRVGVHDDAAILRSLGQGGAR